MRLVDRVRRNWHLHVRGYRGEICGDPHHLHTSICQGCSRPVGVVRRASSGIWNYVVTGEPQTTYTVRGSPAEERAEGAGGVLCLCCFDRLAEEFGIHLRWESRAL